MPYPYTDDENQLAPEIILGARQLPNPQGLAPRMDTDGPPPTRFTGGAKLVLANSPMNSRGTTAGPHDETAPPSLEDAVNYADENTDTSITQPGGDGFSAKMRGGSTPPSGNMVMQDAGAQPAPDTSGLPGSSHGAPQAPQGQPGLAPIDQSGLAGHALMQEGQARHAAQLKKFDQADAALTAAPIKSPDEFKDPNEYSKYLSSITEGRKFIQAERAHYELTHPWGSMESAHPGMFGKIGHAFGEIGNVAGEAFAPGLAEAIPGSRAHLLEQQAQGEAGVKTAIGEQGAIAGQEQKSAAADLAHAKVPTEETKQQKDVAQAGLANERQDQLSQATPAVDKQVFAAGQRIAAGQGTDKDFAMVQSYHQLQQMKREATMKNAPANIKTEYEQAVKDGDDAKAAQLLKIAHDYSTATQPPQRSPQELVVTPEGKAQTIREGSTIEPGTKSAKDAMKGATADETRRADLARNMNENLDQLEDLLKRRPDMFGPVAGRWTALKQLVGTEDQDVAAAHTIKEQMGMAMVGAHAMRNAQHVEAAANSIINSFKNGPDATHKAVEQARKSLATFQQDAGEKPGSAPKNAPKGGGNEIHYKIVNGQLVKQ